MRIALYFSPVHTVPPTEEHILAPWYLGAHLANGLVERGHEVTLFAAAGSRTRAKLVSLENRSGKWEVGSGKWEERREVRKENENWQERKRRLADLWEDEQRLGAEMFYRARKGEFDIVHSHLIGKILPLAVLAVEIPTLFTVHNPFSERLVQRLKIYQSYKSQIPNPKSQTNPKFKIQSTKSLPLAGFRPQPGQIASAKLPFGANLHYAALSQAHRRSAAAYGGGDLPFAGVVYNGVDLNKFKIKNLKLKIKEDEYLLALGRIRPEKGQAEAVTVAQRTGLPLIIAGEVVSGDAEGEKYYQERIKPFLDGWQIKQMGVVSRSQLVSLYQGALCLLMPISWEEPFGLVMIEAMSCGTPVIAFDRGSVAEVIRDGKTGFIVGDKTYRTYRTYKTYKSGIEGMVEAVRQFKVQSSKFKVQMRRNCRRWVDENFSMEKMVEGYERIYQKFKVQN